jgi:hypothetical protein
MKRIRHTHDVKRCTVNQLRPAFQAARVACWCGELFYGVDRLSALDAHTAHILDIRAMDAFKLHQAEG